MSVRGSIGVAWILETVFAEMVAEAERSSPCETGGILMGYWAEGHPQVVIAKATGPVPLAVHGRGRFIPDSGFDREQIARIYRESGRTETYLGDWHSHPGGKPTLSWRDRRTLGRIAADPAARAPIPLMAVLVEGPLCTLAVWRNQPRSWRFPLASGVARLQLRPY